jgi:hypothetical protein
MIKPDDELILTIEKYAPGFSTLTVKGKRCAIDKQPARHIVTLTNASNPREASSTQHVCDACCALFVRKARAEGVLINNRSNV